MKNKCELCDKELGFINNIFCKLTNTKPHKFMCWKCIWFDME